MKDVYTLFNEALAELRKSPEKEKKFRSLVPIGAKITVEGQLNCALSVLKGNIEEARLTLNGAGDNADVTELVESYKKRQYLAAKASGMSEADARGFSGYAPNSGESDIPSDVKAFSEAERKNYDMAIMMKFSHDDAVKLVQQGFRF